MNSGLICYIFSNQRINPPNGLLFNFAKSGRENMVPLTCSSQSNPFLLKYNLKISSKVRCFFVVYDKRDPENEVVYFCKIPKFSNYFICFISSKGFPKTCPKNKMRLRWLNDKIKSKEDIENCLNFAYSPHKFNNFLKTSKRFPILSPVDEARNLILKFKPNGNFLKKQKYFDFTLDFITFYQGNENNFIHSPIFDYFLKYVLSELKELEYYVELSAITFISNSMDHPSPLEFTNLNNHNLDEERITKICESMMAFHGPLFLIWVFNIHCISLFESLFDQWKTDEKTDHILKLVSQKLQINDFSFVSLKKYIRFVKKFFNKQNIDELTNMIVVRNDFQFEDSVIDIMKQIFLNMNENITNSQKRVDLIDLTDVKDADRSYFNRIREIRGIWLNIPENYLYMKRPDGIDYKMNLPPYTFREGKPEKPKKQTTKSTCTFERNRHLYQTENRIRSAIGQKVGTDITGDTGFRMKNELSSKPIDAIFSSKNKILISKRSDEIKLSLIKPNNH